MRIEEVKPLPEKCRSCPDVKQYGVDAACYNCDYALERFRIIKEVKQKETALPKK